jgi:tRNA (uracil-5-)-methyltransferase TRM9
MDLYSSYANEFSSTRQSPWDGWKQLTKYFKDKNNTVLDLACGNGRFLKFLSTSKTDLSRYLGVDNSSPLMEVAGELIETLKNDNKQSSLELMHLDLEESSWGTKIKDKYNLVVAFGITHHLQSRESRRKFFETISYLVEKDGIFIVTFWEFLKMERYIKKLSKLEIIDSTNDFEMTFGKNGAKRFCHFYTDIEVLDLVSNLPFKIVDEFYSDGVEKNQNKYFVFKKI